MLKPRQLTRIKSTPAAGRAEDARPFAWRYEHSRTSVDFTIKSFLIGMMILAFSLSASANSDIAVETNIYNNEVLLGSPSFSVHINSNISVSEYRRYKLSLKTGELKNHRYVFVAIELKIAGDEHVVSTNVPFGKETTIEMGNAVLKILIKRL